MRRYKLAAISTFLKLLIRCAGAMPGNDLPQFAPARMITVGNAMYPAGCTASGSAMLQLTVDKDGRVKAAEILYHRD